MHRSFGLLTCDMKLMRQKQCNVDSANESRDKSYGDRLQRCDLLSLESRRIERDMHSL